MKKIFLALLISGASATFIACNPTSTVSTQSGANQNSAEPTEDNVSAPETLNAQEAGTLIDQWNNAINQKDYAALTRFYGADVSYDGKVMGPEDVAKEKEKEAGSKNISRQQIRDLVVSAPQGNVRQVEFIKQSIMNGKTQEYGVIMMMEADKGIWKIVAEKNTPKEVEIKQNTPRQIAETDIQSCQDAAIAIFLSAPEVQDLLGDPQVQYKIEYTPEDVGNPNGRYWFWVYMPHTGNTETYGRFQVDPSSGKLYEYNSVTDDIKPATFNDKLSRYIKERCGK